MRCTICGMEISDNSRYCRKCGTKIQNHSITTENLRNEITELKETGDSSEIKNYYNTLLNLLDLKKFEKVTYIYEPVDLSVLNLFDEEGNLQIHLMKEEDFIKLSVALILNEVEGFHEELADISKGQHDDRIAQVEAANELYNQALLTEDREIRIKFMCSAMASLQEGINKLKKEMMNNLELFQRLPKSTVKKLFCGISRRKVCAALAEIREGFDCYVNSVGLLIGINASLGDKDAKKRVKCNILEESQFLSEMRQSGGYRRLLEVDDEKCYLWEKKINVLQSVMDDMSIKLETSKIALKIEEKENE